ncbi:DUF4280 domain-containing protein [Francisella sp. TX07-6608]|uniref:DUF4280 domain-containing protein n=1 Tax=Francisella sp. TX07-6608 TaxID=573568 RepID=UPI0008F9D1CD|nr:DUF4280 domain-containing protein [Francisella sp. TX07-6608]OIN83945.1 hypothetical protein KX00_263 [Francisella sp. TX07-6608]
MSKQVCLGAQLKCSFGQSPASLVVLPKPFSSNQKPAAVITDSAPMINIPSFGMCSCPANPAVVAATAAAMGVFTPAPCVPATPATWSPGASKVKVNEIPSLTDNSKLNCAFGGVIEIQQPAQDKVDIE